MRRSWLAAAAVLALAGGCTFLPRRLAPPAIPAPPVPQDAAGTVPVTVTAEGDESTTFRKTATDRQRYQVHLDFGKVFEAQGNFERALQEYHDALTVAESKAHPRFRAADRALAHRRMAAALDRLGRFPEAEVQYQKAMKLTPKDPKVWNDAGYSAYLQGRWADAERAFQRALKLAPEDPRIRTNLGLTLAAAGRSQEALALLGRTQGDVVGQVNLGYLLAATGQYDLARHHYQQALATRPDLDLARRALAQLDRQQREELRPAATPTHLAAVAPATIDSVDPEVTPASETQVSIPPPRTFARPVDPRVRPVSASSPDDIILPPPLPLLPFPNLPSRTLP